MARGIVPFDTALVRPVPAQRSVGLSTVNHSRVQRLLIRVQFQSQLLLERRHFKSVARPPIGTSETRFEVFRDNQWCLHAELFALTDLHVR